MQTYKTVINVPHVNLALLIDHEEISDIKIIKVKEDLQQIYLMEAWY